jgi:hypothetical protein
MKFILFPKCFEEDSQSLTDKRDWSMNSESDRLEYVALHLQHLVVIELAMARLLQQDLGLNWLDLLELRSN